MLYSIEKINPKFDKDVSRIIKQVGAEYGAVGEGFGPSDSEVLNMSRHYNIKTKSLYLVAIKDGKVVGGCGVALFNEKGKICELRKLFLLPESRGLGIGKELVERCLKFAEKQGYKQCYLDTLSNMKGAISLYEKFDFKHLNQPLEGTLHNGCDIWMIKEL